MEQGAHCCGFLHLIWALDQVLELDPLCRCQWQLAQCWWWFSKTFFDYKRWERCDEWGWMWEDMPESAGKDSWIDTKAGTDWSRLSTLLYFDLLWSTSTATSTSFDPFGSLLKSAEVLLKSYQILLHYFVLFWRTRTYNSVLYIQISNYLWQSGGVWSGLVWSVVNSKYAWVRLSSKRHFPN